MAVIGARPAQPWYLGWRTSGSHPVQRQPLRAAARQRRAGRREATRRDIRPFLLAIALAAGLAFFYLSQSTRVAATGYEIDALERALADERATQEQLVWAIGNARSPAEITDRAQRKLRLVPLDDSAVEFVSDPIGPPAWLDIGD